MGERLSQIETGGRCQPIQISRTKQSTMSEANISTDPGGGAERVPLASVSEASAPDASVPAPQEAAATVSHSLLTRIFSFPAMLGALLVGAVFFVLRNFVVDPDLWWHIKTGQSILSTHHWPTTDPYSFTVTGQPWIAYEWLGDVLLALANRFGGVRGLDALLILLGSAIIISLYAYASLRSGNSKAGFVCAATLLLLASPSFTLRPQMMGYFFLILTLIALERFRRGKTRAMWFLPAVFAVWVNTHGSFIIGLGALLVYWVAGLTNFHCSGIETHRWTSSERIRLALVFLLCLVVLPLTPYGSQAAAYPFDMALAQPVNVASILEWQPMPFNLPGGKIFLGLLLLTFFLQATLRLTWRLEELALFLFGVMMACLHVRFLLLFVPFFAPVFAVILARWLPPYQPAKDRLVLNAVLMVIVLAGMLRYFPAEADLQKIVAKQFPVQAVEYLRQHSVPGPMLNTYGFGGYLVYSGQAVFIDGRADVYERGGVLSDYMHITLLKPGALAVLSGYGVRSCILARGEPLTVVLSASPDWTRLYRDDVSEVFVRR